AQEIVDAEPRGEAIAALLPRMRDAGLATDIKDAKRLAFAIGYEELSALAIASITGEPALGTQEDYIKSLLERPLADRDTDDVMIRFLTFPLLLSGLTGDKRKDLLQRAFVNASTLLSKRDQMVLVLAWIASQMEEGERASALDEVIAWI